MENNEENKDAAPISTPSNEKIALLLENRSTFALLNKTSQNIGYEPLGGYVMEGETPIDAVKRIIEEYSGFSVPKNDFIDQIGEITSSGYKTLIYHVDIRDYLHDQIFKWKQPEKKETTEVFVGTIRELIANNSQAMSPLLRISMEMFDNYKILKNRETK